MLGMYELLRLVVVVQIMGLSASGDVVCDVNLSSFFFFSVIAVFRKT